MVAANATKSIGDDRTRPGQRDQHLPQPEGGRNGRNGTFNLIRLDARLVGTPQKPDGLPRPPEHLRSLGKGPKIIDCQWLEPISGRELLALLSQPLELVQQVAGLDSTPTSQEPFAGFTDS
jgi:hypothetical protein